MNKLLIPLLLALLGAGCANNDSKPAASSSTAAPAIAPLAPPSSRPNDMRSQTLAAHPEWSPEVQQFVREGRLGVGMPDEAVKASWGTPAEKIASNDGGVKKEEWIYRYPADPKVTHLNFADGKLTSWQQTP